MRGTVILTTDNQRHVIRDVEIECHYSPDDEYEVIRQAVDKHLHCEYQAGRTYDRVTFAAYFWPDALLN